MDISGYKQLNTRMCARGKRPLRNLTPNDKVRAIQRIHNGETKASVSRDIGVPESTLRGWCKNEQKLRFMCHQINNSSSYEIFPNLSHENFQSAGKKRKLDTSNPFNMTTKFITEISNTDKMNSLNSSTNDNIKCDNSLLEDALGELIKGNLLQNSEGMKNNITRGGGGEIPHTFSLPCSTTTTSNAKNIFKQHILKNSMSISGAHPFFSSVPENCMPKAVQSGTHLNSRENCYTHYYPKYFNKEITYSTETSDYSPPLGESKNGYINRNEIDSTYNNTNEEESKFLQWQAIFNASLNFFALASAATTLQPAGLYGIKSDISKICTSSEYSRASPCDISTSIVQNDVLNEAPEDLSLSSANSKMFATVKSPSQSPVKSSSTGSDFYI
uniref:Protein distal antenna-related n=1 Tax=Ceratitis capitata TaxID=7213 RepID=W8BKE5_CERCA